jgi:hypothetical protein
MDPNGINSAFGLGHLDANNFMMPPQDMNFSAGTDGMAFPDPSLMMMANQQLTMGGGLELQSLNGNSNAISAGK